MSSVYLMLLIFLLAILIPACVYLVQHFSWCTLHTKLNKQCDNILEVLLSRFGSSLLFHVQFQLLLLDLHIDFSGDRSGGLVFPSLGSNCWDPHSQSFDIVNKAEVYISLELSIITCLLISMSSTLTLIDRCHSSCLPSLCHPDSSVFPHSLHQFLIEFTILNINLYLYLIL